MLAINGGEKFFKDTDENKYIHPTITEDIEKAIIDQLHKSISIYDNSGIFKKFEKNFSEYHRQKYGLVTSSGTSALWSMYEGISLKQGDEIICPVYTFFATVTPILFTGALPVFIDCDRFGSIDAKKIEKHITSRTKAIVVTHMWGYPCEMDKLRTIADKYNIYLLEDVSHAHGASYKGKKLGEWGDAAAFSLQGNKVITGGEGGILITSNRNLYERAILLGHYNKRCFKEINKESDSYKFSTTGKGMKLRAHPLAIRLAYEQFKNLEGTLKNRNKLADLFTEGVSDLEGIDVLVTREGGHNSHYALIIKYSKEKLFNVDREKFVEALHAEGAIEVDIPKSTCPLNYLPIFKQTSELFDEYMCGEINLNKTYASSETYFKSIIKLPVWYGEGDQEIVQQYIGAFRKVIKNIGEII